MSALIHRLWVSPCLKCSQSCTPHGVNYAIVDIVRSRNLDETTCTRKAFQISRQLPLSTDQQTCLAENYGRTRSQKQLASLMLQKAKSTRYIQVLRSVNSENVSPSGYFQMYLVQKMHEQQSSPAK